LIFCTLAAKEPTIELEAKGEQNFDLIKAGIETIRKKLEAERPQ